MPTSSAAQPVGLFDSGVGGLSVLREVQRLLPNEDLVYVADSAFCPYGGRPRDEILDRAHTLTAFLAGQPVKALVVACNTATVAAVDDLRARWSLPIVGMEPAVKPAVAATHSGVVGVLATGTTLAGNRFARLLQRYADGVEVLTQPCPGLVDQVEKGDLDGPETVELLRRFVTPLLDRGADTLVLGCTHYPFLRSTIADLVGPGITLIETGAAVARQLARVLDAQGLRQPRPENGEVRLFTSGDAQALRPVVRALCGVDAVQPLPYRAPVQPAPVLED